MNDASPGLRGRHKLSPTVKLSLMTYEAFIQQIISALELPFELEDVEQVDANCGTAWIILKNGKVYALHLIGCEPEEQE